MEGEEGAALPAPRPPFDAAPTCVSGRPRDSLRSFTGPKRPPTPVGLHSQKALDGSFRATPSSPGHAQLSCLLEEKNSGILGSLGFPTSMTDKLDEESARWSWMAGGSEVDITALFENAAR